MTTLINRSSAGFRPYRLEGREVGNVHFYRKGEVILSTNRGWIERHSPDFISRDVTQIRIESLLRRAVKVNLTKGGHFYINDRKASYGEKRYEIYFDLDEGDFEVGDEVMIEFSRDARGVTYAKTMALTGTFESGKRETITVLIGNSFMRANNAYGEKMKALHAALEAKNISRSMNPEDFVKHPDLLRLLNEAAALYSATKTQGRI